MSKIIAEYEASLNKVIIYSGSLQIEANEDSVKVGQAVVEEIRRINDKFGGGIPDNLIIKSWQVTE